MWYFTPSPRALTWITKLHRRLYRATGGMLGSILPQLEDSRGRLEVRKLTVLLLTTTGRKSAAQRTVPLPCYAYEGRTFIVASFAGREEHPAWYLNLTVRPEVEVQLRSRKSRYRAVTLSGAERARIWTMLIEDWPRYRGYQNATSREIPLVELIAV